jgi:hypothetical protein
LPRREQRDGRVDHLRETLVQTVSQTRSRGLAKRHRMSGGRGLPEEPYQVHLAGVVPDVRRDRALRVRHSRHVSETRFLSMAGFRETSLFRARSKGEQTAITILDDKFSRVPWCVGKGSRELDSARHVLGM